MSEIHMPCGCPYPKLGDRLPCVHGYPGDDEGEIDAMDSIIEGLRTR